MYASTNATREHSLKAAAAAWRAIERHVCCKSQFKFKCFSCGEMVNRGDKITRCVRKTTGMNLRYRGADCCNGLAMAETVFYQGETGENMWVHIGCQPCYWYKGFDNGDESSPPGLREMPTEWGAKLMMEWADWTSGPGGESWLIMGLPHFLKVKGYPKEKSMKKRIINAVIRFQAIWRGYLYKKAYPEALLQSQAEQMFPHEMEAAADEEIDAALLYRQQTCWEEEDEFGNTFYRENKRRKGSNTAILFDRGKKNEAIYSCKIAKIAGEANGVHVYVRFHYDQEWKKYHWKKFQKLERECRNFMIKMDIMLDTFVGKISTHHRHRWQNGNIN